MKKSIYRMKPSAYIQMDFSNHTKKKNIEILLLHKENSHKKKDFFPTFSQERKFEFFFYFFFRISLWSFVQHAHHPIFRINFLFVLTSI